MSIPFWCVFISALLIYVARMPVANHRRFFSQGAQRPASER